MEVEAEDNKSRKLTILYGSQTGTAEDVAERIGREGRRRYFECKVMALNDFDVSDLIKEETVIFSVATTGQGDPPDNMKKFWKFILRKNLPSSSLTNLQISVIGLGDSSYLKFNFIAKKLCRRLQQLGARMISDIGLADEQHSLGLDGVIDPWLEKLWSQLLDVYPLPPGKDIIPADITPPAKFLVNILDTSTDYSEIISKQKQLRMRSTNDEHVGNSWCRTRPFMANLINSERVTSADHFQDVRLIRFDLSHSGITYYPGDVIMIQPCNILSAANEFVECLSLSPNMVLEIKANEYPLPSILPEVSCIKYLAEHYFDFQGVPKRYFFELLSFFAPSELEKGKLQEFASAEGQEELNDYCYRQKRSYLEVLKDFPHAAANIPIEYLFDLIPPLQARAFSIASSQEMFPHEAHILMAVVKYKTKIHKPRQGVCSTWLASINPHENQDIKIPVWVTSGTIKFPVADSIPVIMIGPGTGCAPFRSFIQQRVSVIF